MLLVHRRDSDGAVERAYRAIRRHRPGQGSGGIAAKHALALLSSSPPPSPFVTSRRSVDLHVRDLDAVDREGPVVVDAVTVDFLQESPTVVALVRFEDGSRGWATARNQATIDAVTSEETVGGAAGVRGSRLILR